MRPVGEVRRSELCQHAFAVGLCGYKHMVYAIVRSEDTWVAEILVGREWCPELKSVGSSHVAFHALARRCTCKHAYLKAVAGFMLFYSPFGQFAAIIPGRCLFPEISNIL